MHVADQTPTFPLSSGEVVATLGRLGLLELNSPDAGVELSEREDAYPVSWKDVYANPRRQLTETVGIDPERRGWDLVRDDMQQRIRGLTGKQLPPPPPLFDFDAWYQPVHYFGQNWGIFIRESAVLEGAAAILLGVEPARRLKHDVVLGAVRMSLGVFFLHEMFHHKVESFAIRLEIVERSARFCPYRKAVYNPLRDQSSDDLLEETLATSESYLRLSEEHYRRRVPADVFEAARHWVTSIIPRMPPGYRMAIHYLHPGSFDDGLNVLSSQLHEATSSPARNPHEWRLAPQVHRGLFNCKAKTWVVVPVGSRPIIPWFDSDISGLAISSRKMIQGLQRHFGYQVLAGRGKGSHVVLKADGLPEITLPGGREAVSAGLAKQIARDLGFQSTAALWAELSG